MTALIGFGLATHDKYDSCTKDALVHELNETIAI